MISGNGAVTYVRQRVRTSGNGAVTHVRQRVRTSGNNRASSMRNGILVSHDKSARAIVHRISGIITDDNHRVYVTYASGINSAIAKPEYERGLYIVGVRISASYERAVSHGVEVAVIASGYKNPV